MAKIKYILGFMILVVLSASVYILLPENIRIDVGKTQTTFKVWENNSWILAGTEYTRIYDGTTLMRASNRIINYSVDLEKNRTTIWRYAYFKDGIIAIDTYEFYGGTKNKERYPVSHKIRILNAEGKRLVYEVNDLLYTGNTTNDIPSPQSFGHNMKVEWESGNYYSRIWKYKNKDVGKLEVKYRIDSDDYSKNVRLFDPTTITLETPQVESLIDLTICDDTGCGQGHYGFQLKYNMTAVPSGSTINDAKFCIWWVNKAGTIDTDVTVSRVDDQGWTDMEAWDDPTILQAQSLTHTSSTYAWSSVTANTWGCVNITYQIAGAVAASDQNLTLRFIDPDNVVGSIIAVDFTNNEFGNGINPNIIIGETIYNNWGTGKYPYVNITYTEGAADTCTCPGTGINWEVDMEDNCTLSTPCTLGTGNLSWIGNSGYFNCSAELNLTNRNAPPNNTIFYYSAGCVVNRI